jgi:hypothetical protein
MLNLPVNLASEHMGFLIAAIGALCLWLLTILVNSRAIHTMDPQKIRESAAEFNSDQMQRMWDQLMHEDNLFSDRLNFFLVFESVLLGGASAIYSRSSSDLRILQATSIFGLVITLLWFVIQARHKQGLDVLKIRTRALFPEYALATLKRRRPPFSVSWLLAYWLPLLVACVWLGLLLLSGA